MGEPRDDRATERAFVLERRGGREGSRAGACDRSERRRGRGREGSGPHGPRRGVPQRARASRCVAAGGRFRRARIQRPERLQPFDAGARSLRPRAAGGKFGFLLARCFAWRSALSLARPFGTRGGRSRPTTSMSEEPLDRIVLRYLQKRGYKDAERALKSEAKIQSLSQMALVPHLGADATIADHILFYNESDSDPNALVQGYRLLREWVHNSLDLYKVRPPRSPVAPAQLGESRARSRGFEATTLKIRVTDASPPAPLSPVAARVDAHTLPHVRVLPPRAGEPRRRRHGARVPPSLRLRSRAPARRGGSRAPRSRVPVSRRRRPCGEAIPREPPPRSMLPVHFRPPRQISSHGEPDGPPRHPQRPHQRHGGSRRSIPARG